MLWALNYMLPDYMKDVLIPTTGESYEPCADNYMNSYLNRQDVKAALHVDASIVFFFKYQVITFVTSDGLCVS
jgi:hypothetical protein